MESLVCLVIDAGLQCSYYLRPFQGRTGWNNGIGGVWRSLVAHLLWEQGVGGSNPSTPTTGFAAPDVGLGA